MSNDTRKSRRALVDGLFATAGDGSEVRLVISRCAACGAQSFPARTVRCAACSSAELVEAESAMDGTLYSWTATPRGGVPDSTMPLVVGLVNLASGLTVQGILADEADALTIDAKVTGCVIEHGVDEKDGATLLGYGFRLARGEEAAS